jgi:hypothetical protein
MHELSREMLLLLLEVFMEETININLKLIRFSLLYGSGLRSTR